MVKERVMAWNSRSASSRPKSIKYSVPNLIMFYRDGVSDTQYGMVYDHELSQIEEGWRAAVNELVEETSRNDPTFDKIKNRPNDVKIVAVVVTKRHHTRFFEFDVKPI
jgi:eukaryotic translation initiation factor 2C